MKRFVLITVLFTTLLGCTKENDPQYPECIGDKITWYFQNYSPSTPRATIELYSYNNEDVFVVNFQNFPDGLSYVVNQKCETICTLPGGLAGGSENDCLNFENAVYIKTIWVDNR